MRRSRESHRRRARKRVRAQEASNHSCITSEHEISVFILGFDHRDDPLQAGDTGQQRNCGLLKLDVRHGLVRTRRSAICCALNNFFFFFFFSSPLFLLGLVSSPTFRTPFRPIGKIVTHFPINNVSLGFVDRCRLNDAQASDEQLTGMIRHAESERETERQTNSGETRLIAIKANRK